MGKEREFTNLFLNMKYYFKRKMIFSTRLGKVY